MSLLTFQMMLLKPRNIKLEHLIFLIDLYSYYPRYKHGVNHCLQTLLLTLKLYRLAFFFTNNALIMQNHIQPQSENRWQTTPAFRFWFRLVIWETLLPHSKFFSAIQTPCKYAFAWCKKGMKDWITSITNTAEILVCNI